MCLICNTSSKQCYFGPCMFCSHDYDKTHQNQGIQCRQNIFCHNNINHPSMTSQDKTENASLSICLRWQQCVGRRANRVVYAKEDFFAAGHVSHQLKNIKNRRKPSQWCACVEVKSEKTLKPQMRTKCGPSGVTSLSLAIVSSLSSSRPAHYNRNSYG